MTEKKTLPLEVLTHIAQMLNLPLRGIIAVIELLDDAFGPKLLYGGDDVPWNLERAHPYSR